MDVWPQAKARFTGIPAFKDWVIDRQNASYFHYCDNETVHGVEFHDNFPFDEVLGPKTNSGDPLLLVSDMSSNLCSRAIDWDRHALVYAGTQKNVGPAGACITIIREDLIGSRKRADTPAIMDWETFANAPAKLHNTPATWSVYVSGLNIAHMLKQGGVKHYDVLAKTRSKMLYDFMDNSGGFYVNSVDPRYRSRMNIPFRVLNDERLEDKFIKEAIAEGLLELKGHKAVGGCRASMYNAMPIEGTESLIRFMRRF